MSTPVSIDPFMQADQANALAQSISAPTVPVLAPPPATTVTLVDGREAEVRELNGRDEEHIFKRRGSSLQMDAIMERGTVAVDGKPADRALLDGLLLGDRDLLLIGIRRSTYGDEMKLSALRCPHCDDEADHFVDLRSEVPMHAGTATTTRVVLRDGRQATVSAATVAVANEMAKMSEKNPDLGVPELNTRALSSLVLEINGVPPTPEEIRSMGMADRQTLLDGVNAVQVGPDWGKGITTECPACGDTMTLPIWGVGNLYPFL